MDNAGVPTGTCIHTYTHTHTSWIGTGSPQLILLVSWCRGSLGISMRAPHMQTPLALLDRLSLVRRWNFHAET